MTAAAPERFCYLSTVRVFALRALLLYAMFFALCYLLLFVALCYLLLFLRSVICCCFLYAMLSALFPSVICCYVFRGHPHQPRKYCSLPSYVGVGVSLTYSRPKGSKTNNIIQSPERRAGGGARGTKSRASLL